MIYACEHHDAVLEHWQLRDTRDIRLVHVDFHDDLRGLLVDRRQRLAYPIGRAARSWPMVDPGNFLAHAVVQGRVRGIRWLHERIGGRGWDAGIVRYESDLSAAHHRLAHRLRRGPEYPLEFEEGLLESWGGLKRGELLSVDWDCFASILTERTTIDTRVTAFLEGLGSVIPEHTWVAYSPEYSHPSLDPFKRFVQRLGERFAQPVEWLSPGLPAGQLHPTDVDASLPRSPLMRLTLYLRRKGIF